MKTILLVLLASLCAQTFASSKTFDWHSLIGTYDYVSCPVDEDPVWGGKRDQLQVEIAADAEDANTLYVWMERKDPTPLRVGWTLEAIDQGTYEWKNPETGHIDTIKNDYTTSEGLFGDENWDYVIDTHRSFGKTSVALKFDADGLLDFKSMVQQQSEVPVHVGCTLKRQLQSMTPQPHKLQWRCIARGYDTDFELAWVFGNWKPTRKAAIENAMLGCQELLRNCKLQSCSKTEF